MSDGSDAPAAPLALGSRPPDWDPQELAAIAGRHFDLDGDPHPLGGERDQNLRMYGANGAPMVVKRSGADESLDALAFQTAALRHLACADPDLNVPRAVASNRGEDVVCVSADPAPSHPPIAPVPVHRWAARTVPRCDSLPEDCRGADRRRRGPEPVDRGRHPASARSRFGRLRPQHRTCTGS